MTSFGNGTLIVGTDISPGTYRSQGGTGCYWYRLAGFAGLSSDFIDSGYATVPTVTIAATDKGFTSENCGTWTRV